MNVVIFNINYNTIITIVYLTINEFLFLMCSMSTILYINKHITIIM